MTIEAYVRAQAIRLDIDKRLNALENINNYLAQTAQTPERTRIRGFELEIPRGTVRAEAQKKKNDLEAELAALQAEFDAL